MAFMAIKKSRNISIAIIYNCHFKVRISTKELGDASEQYLSAADATLWI